MPFFPQKWWEREAVKATPLGPIFLGIGILCIAGLWWVWKVALPADHVAYRIAGFLIVGASIPAMFSFALLYLLLEYLLFQNWWLLATILIIGILPIGRR